MIALPASNAEVLARVIVPALERLPEKMRTPRAQVMLLAIGRQESGFAARRQNGGPARGFWQFELGGVSGVLQHKSSAPYAPIATPDALMTAIENDDLIACRIARLLLYTLPQPLPAIGDADDAWKQYVSAWRPGKPRPLTWPAYYAQAVEAIP